MGGEGRREEENEVGRKDGEKKRDRVIVRQRNNMRCIPTTNRECIGVNTITQNKHSPWPQNPH